MENGALMPCERYRCDAVVILVEWFVICCIAMDDVLLPEELFLLMMSTCSPICLTNLGTRWFVVVIMCSDAEGTCCYYDVGGRCCLLEICSNYYDGDGEPLMLSVVGVWLFVVENSVLVYWVYC